VARVEADDTAAATDGLGREEAVDRGRGSSGLGRESREGRSRVGEERGEVVGKRLRDG
jgi:hypothetical protein